MLPWSGKPSFKSSTGAVRATSRTKVDSMYGQACLETWSPHRCQPPVALACLTFGFDRVRFGLTRCPAQPSKAGRIVSDARTINATTIDTATAAAVMKGSPAIARPKIAITTVPPAKITDSPAVAFALPAASSTVKPSASPSRNLVTMKSA